MVKGSGNRPNSGTSRTKVIIRHLPHNIKDIPELQKQIFNYTSQQQDDPQRTNSYKARLQQHFGIQPPPAPVVPQLYGKHHGQSQGRSRAKIAFTKPEDVKIVSFLSGKPGTKKKPPRYSTAYIEFRYEDEARLFCTLVDGKEFCTQLESEVEDSSPVEPVEAESEGADAPKSQKNDEDEERDANVTTQCVCEYSTTTWGRRRRTAKANPLAGTLEEDQSYKDFIENFEQEKSMRLPSAEVALENEQEEAAGEGAAEAVVAKKTNLGKYLEAKLREKGNSSKWKGKAGRGEKGKKGSEKGGDKHGKKKESGAKDGKRKKSKPKSKAKAKPNSTKPNSKPNSKPRPAGKSQSNYKGRRRNQNKASQGESANQQ